MSIADIQKTIRSALDGVEAAFGRGTTPAELLEIWYDDEVIVAGEGDPCAGRGVAALLAKAEQMLTEMGPHPTVRFTIDEPILAEGALAVVLLDCTLLPDLPGAETQSYRILTAWRPGPRGWRIVREMFAVGPL